jgi:O-antigen/teichoic acid export membrane protein
MLMPEDFGLVAIVNVFMTLANTVIETSFSSAIIQRESVSKKMLSSFFWVNVALSVSLYLVLFLIAPFVSAFYGEAILIPILRMQGLRVIVSAAYSIQQALLNRKMRFKALFFCTLIGSVVQGGVGLFMACYDKGIWALVVSSCVGSLAAGLAIIVVEPWRPDVFCSFDLVREALVFSSKILVIRVVKKIYYNIRVLMIGRVYDAEVLGYFNKGFQFPSTAMTIVDGSLTSVAFSHLSKLQSDKQRFVASLRQYVRCAMFICMPIMVGMILVAKPMVLFLLTERWIACVPFLQIICVSQLLIPLSIKTTAFEALGRSDLSMRLNLIGIVSSILLLFISMPFSPLVMTLSGVISNLLLQICITVAAAKDLGYSMLDQCKDALCGLIPTLIMMGALFLLQLVDFQAHYLMEVVTKVTIGVVAFVLGSIVTANDVFCSILDVAKMKFQRN